MSVFQHPLEGRAIHVIANTLTDLSPHLETLSAVPSSPGAFLSNADKVRHPVDEDGRLNRQRRTVTPQIRVLPKGRNFHQDGRSGHCIRICR